MANKFVVAGLAGMVGLSAVAGVLSVASPAAAQGHGRMGWHAHGEDWGDRRGPRMGPAALCGPEREERLSRMVEMIEGFANFSPEQQPAWEQLRDAVSAAGAKLGPACDAMRDSRDGTPPERLASMETMLSAGLDAMREIRPKFDAFYATLNDKQKRAIDRLVEGHGHHRR